MPEITDSELREFVRYQNLGTPTDVQKKISDLETDNAKQRDEMRTMKENLPKDGQVVVAKEDAELLPKYKELGQPDEVKKNLDEGKTAKERAAELETFNAATSFAKAAGLAEEAVPTLVAIPTLSGAKFEVRKVKGEDGKEAEVGYVTLPGEDQKAMSYKDAVEKVPALKGLRTATDGKPDESGKPFVRQGGESGNGPAGGTVYDRIRKQREEQGKAKDQASPEKTALEKQFGTL